MKSLFEKRILLDGRWKLFYEENFKLPKNMEYISSEELEKSKFNTVPATVPGNFEIDLEKAGIIDDIFFGTNPIEAQKRENYHLWYSKEFEFDGEDEYELVFEGVDTFSDIYLNGQLIGSTDNMFIAHKFAASGLIKGKNELVVHIKPVFLYAKENPIDADSTNHQPYNAESLNVRKAAHMYGWDIMPRILSGGIWKSVYLRKITKDKIKELYLRTGEINDESATLSLYYNLDFESDFVTDYRFVVRGKCKDSFFNYDFKPFDRYGTKYFKLTEPFYLWWTKDMGEPDLYDVIAELYRDGELVDKIEFDLGVRTFELERSSTVGKEGKFCFILNGQRLFVRGTNWVPVDALHSRDKGRYPKVFELLDESGCNMVRCWGGNVYEDHDFFDFCDKHGIAVWQDFAMGCAKYPQNEKLCRALEKEATAIVKRYRQHTCIAIWTGDNECDEASAFCAVKSVNPNENILTRKVLPEVIRRHDPERVFMPSSPYIDEKAFSTRKAGDTPERHIWGPRDNFKSDFYTKNNVIFASEIGYHGSPAPKSLEKFISRDKLWPWRKNKEWQAHASCMELHEDAAYSYRIALMFKQAEIIFGEEPKSLERFTKVSQACQAEAMKFFVERFRSAKWNRTGIIWWNLVDGWPQFSDAVTDYYYAKKLAFYVIKRSQQPICLMFREPENRSYTVVAANETLQDVKLNFKITDFTDNKVLLDSKTVIISNAVTEIVRLPQHDENAHFYVMDWEYNGKHGKNYYFAGQMPYDFDDYFKYMTDSGMWKADF